MTKNILLAFTFVLFATGVSANGNCPSGREVTLNHPTCYDLQNPLPLEKSCRHEAHGWDSVLASSTPMTVVSPWVDGGTGQSYDSHCRQSLGLNANQEAQYTGYVSEQTRTHNFKKQYQYTCSYNILVKQYADKVSPHCVPESERYPTITSDQCLTPDQKDLIVTIDEMGYSSLALESYLVSLQPDDIQWTLEPEQNSGSIAVSLCTDCSDIGDSIPKSVKVPAQLNCLASLKLYDPYFEKISSEELSNLKAMAKPLVTSVELNQMGYAEDDLKYLQSLLNFILDGQ